MRPIAATVACACAAALLAAGCTRPPAPVPGSPGAALAPEPAALPPPPAAADAGAAPAPTAEECAARAAELMGGGGDPAALEAAARLCETAAVRAPAPAAALLLAARARRTCAAAWASRAEAARPDAAPGQTGRELLAAQAADARLCAADARGVWSALFPAAASAADAGRPPAEAAALVGEAGAEPLYLEAACAAAWARAQGFTALVERRAELQALLERAGQLAPGLDDAGPDRELGHLLASLPAYAGGNLREARARFDAALARAPGSVRTRVLYARGVAVKLQDRALFDLLLRDALAQPAAAAAEAAWADQARSLQQRADDLFGAGQ